MSKIRIPAVLICLVFVATMCAVRALGDMYHQSTRLTFNEPVEIPGMVLSPGTYEFRLIATNSDLNHVEIQSGDGMHLIAILVTNPVTRPDWESNGQTEVTFEKRAPGAPEAIKDWFYAGDTNGHEFVYWNKAEKLGGIAHR